MIRGENHKETIFKSIKKLEQWVESHDYKGFDPGDGLTSFLRPLTFNNLFLSRLLLQLIWKSPINLRPLLGVKPRDSFIGRGYMAWGYLTMLKTTKETDYERKASACLEWLMENKAPGYENYCWGKMFDFTSRGGWQWKFQPITVWSSLIGQVFLDAFEILGEERYLDVAVSICEWILKLPRNETDSGSCINYTPTQGGNCTVHNQSMLAAALLVRTASFRPNREFLKVAKEAVVYTCSRQNPDGSWYYGEGPKWRWIDNFHTAYNLDALKCYIECTDDTRYSITLNKGFKFFKANFFDVVGRPKYYHNRKYPIDSQCAAQSIETLAKFHKYDKSALGLSMKVAKWTIRNMQDRSGYFYFRQYPLIKAKVPMIHWAQATMYRALALLLERIRRADSGVKL